MWPKGFIEYLYIVIASTMLAILLEEETLIKEEKDSNYL
jgi:hypothetical protein